MDALISRVPRLSRWSLVAGCLGLIVLCTCSRDTVSVSEWRRMSHEDRVLYVKSVIGGEKAKEAKGGSGKTFDRPAEEYVMQIDQAYSRGDQREAHEILAELAR